MSDNAISVRNARIIPAARRWYTADHARESAATAAAISATTATSRTTGPTIASVRRPSAACAASIPGAMISDQYRNPVRKPRTAMSIAAVIAVSSRTPRCGHATSAMNGSADPESCRMMCHLNHGSGTDRKISSDAHPNWPISQSAGHAAMAPQKTAWRPRQSPRRRTMTTSGAIGGRRSAALPTSRRARESSPSARTTAA